MAGIGFELKKVFKKKGLLATLAAYGYAGIVCTGPMILGIVLLLGIRLLGELSGTGRSDIDLVNAMVTYGLLASLLLTDVFSLVTTRYIADMLYMEKKDRVLPSFWGSVSVQLVIGWALYGTFLCFAGITPGQVFMNIVFFSVMVVVWMEMNYLTAIKDYRGILVTFALAVGLALLVGWLLIRFTKIPAVPCLLGTAIIAYSVMAVLYFRLMLKYFPMGNASSMGFLEWMDRNPALCFVGLFTGIGVFGHLVIMWFSPLQHRVQGLFFEAPAYDIPALIAFLSILITTINFVTSVEVNFYPKYRTYFSLFNKSGSLSDIEQAGEEMKRTLTEELANTFIKQFFVTVVFIVLGSLVLPYLPLGFTEDMLGIFRVLCLGYGFYAMGNCLMLIQLYFSDNKGALISTAAFAAGSVAGTIIAMRFGIRAYGVGFVAGSAGFTLVSLILLYRYLGTLMEHVLVGQPIVAVERRGLLTRIAERREKKYREKFPVWEGEAPDESEFDA